MDINLNNGYGSYCIESAIGTTGLENGWWVAGAAGGEIE